jgi:hypothetical protein
LAPQHRNFMGEPSIVTVVCDTYSTCRAKRCRDCFSAILSHGQNFFNETVWHKDSTKVPRESLLEKVKKNCVRTPQENTILTSTIISIFSQVGIGEVGSNHVDVSAVIPCSSTKWYTVNSIWKHSVFAYTKTERYYISRLCFEIARQFRLSTKLYW